MRELPRYVRYKGFCWSVERLNENQVKLWIIGFNNQHSLRWGISALLAAIDNGDMVIDH